jgi:hypothetical protein
LDFFFGTQMMKGKIIKTIYDVGQRFSEHK